MLLATLLIAFHSHQILTILPLPSARVEQVEPQTSSLWYVILWLIRIYIQQNKTKKKNKKNKQKTKQPKQQQKCGFSGGNLNLKGVCSEGIF